MQVQIAKVPGPEVFEPGPTDLLIPPSDPRHAKVMRALRQQFYRLSRRANAPEPPAPAYVRECEMNLE